MVLGGYHSGQWMAWHDAASNSVSPKVYHLFAVHACFELNGWLFGYDSALPDLHIGHTLKRNRYAE